ncbi:restriction endonuclease subunit S [Algibacter sp. L3A6]|uniref:restriction endonuclease subunit S n=1 Tax=Algibacter sp. L3A6 TaxID=2686366 RepID=UPI00131A6518|nr:restriction endonuclease subunit S [Algibacter sp. L3A6]
MSSLDKKLPDGWMETTLADSVTKLGDGLHGTPKYSDDGEYFFINGNNLNDGKIEIKKETKRCSNEEFEKYKKNLNSRTILVSINGSLGYFAYYNNEKCFLGKSACYFNVKESISKRFIGYQIRTKYFQKYIERLAGGTTIKNISLKTMREFPFIIPKNLEEQKAIAKVLTAFDDKIENLRAQNQTLEQTAQTIFKEWFGKYQVGDELPDGWRIGKLGEIAFNHSKSFKFTEEDVVFVNTGDVSEGQFLHANKVSPIGLPGQAKKAIELYDILYSEIRPKNKRFAFVDFDTSNYVVSTKFMIIRPKDDFSAHILYLLLKNQNTVNEFNVIAESRSGTFPQITFDSISDFPVIIPTKEFQNQFEKILRPLMEKERINHQQIQTLTKTKDTLLPKLMRGEIRVKI